MTCAGANRTHLARLLHCRWTGLRGTIMFMFVVKLVSYTQSRAQYSSVSRPPPSAVGHNIVWIIRYDTVYRASFHEFVEHFTRTRYKRWRCQEGLIFYPYLLIAATTNFRGYSNITMRMHVFTYSDHTTKTILIPAQLTVQFFVSYQGGILLSDLWIEAIS